MSVAVENSKCWLWWKAYLNVLKHDWVDKDGPADTDGPASDTKTVSLGSHSAWENLCGNQEGNGTPGRCVDKVEQEQHGDCGRSDTGCLGGIVTGGFVEGGGL